MDAGRAIGAAELCLSVCDVDECEAAVVIAESGEDAGGGV